MLKVIIEKMTIEIPDEVGLVSGIMGAVPTTVSGPAFIPGPAPEEREAVKQLEAEQAEAEKARKEEEDRKAKEEKKAAEAAAREKKKADEAATKKAKKEEEDAAALQAARDRAAAAAAALEDDAAADSGYTLEQVKATFSALVDKGVNIIEILQEFGVTKVSAIPADRYPEVMDRVKDL